QDLESRDAGKHQVEDHGVEVPVERHASPHLAVRGDRDGEARVRDPDPQRLRELLRVFDEQDPHCGRASIHGAVKKLTSVTVRFPLAPMAAISTFVGSPRVKTPGGTRKDVRSGGSLTRSPSFSPCSTWIS